MQANDVTTFWREAGPERWFRKDEAFDADFRDRFLEAHEAAARGELDGWAADAQGALALLILLDQFPRNAFRGTARMYATDDKARAIAKAAVASGFDRETEELLRNFFYLPYMHSEKAEDLQACERLTRHLGAEPHRFAQHHLDIVRRFGRFPHRNAILGRESTAQEREFMGEGGFAG